MPQLAGAQPPSGACAPAVFPKSVLALGCARQGKTRIRAVVFFTDDDVEPQRHEDV
jgi:hypothetical protein